MSTSTSCHVVADYFLLQVDPMAGDAISNLKLQKLVYYAQAWSLAFRGTPLFPEDIEAWAHGPVVPQLYRRFEAYSWQAIDPTELVSDPLAQLSEVGVELLESVWRAYGKFTGRQLENLTRSEVPWKNAYGDRPQGHRCSEVIILDAMRQFDKAPRKHHASHPRAAPA